MADSTDAKQFAFVVKLWLRDSFPACFDYEFSEIYREQKTLA